MSCTAQTRTYLQQTARALRGRDAVETVTLFEPETGPGTGWTLEVVLSRPDRVPHAVVDELAGGGLGLALPVQRQGDGAILLATV